MKNQANPDESSKLGLIFQNHNSWNLRFGLKQKAQFSTNLILNDRIGRKKNSNKRNEDQTWKNNEDEIAINK
jgi:hypothetical protein